MRIAHLTTVHPPFDTRVFYRECVTLAGAGYDVVMVCCHNQDETINGVRIRALQMPRGRFDRLTRTAWSAWAVARAERADVYHIHDPELLWVGTLLKLASHTVIYDVHEDLPRQVLVKDWVPRALRPLLARVLAAIEWIGARFADGIVAATPLIAGRFPKGRTAVVQNFPVAEEMQPGPDTDYAGRAPNFVYVGNLGRARGIREMIEAIDLIPDAYQARLHIAGDLRSRASDGTLADPREKKLFDEYVRTRGWHKVVHHGWVGRQRLARLLSESRAGLVVLHPTPNYRDAYPVKLFEYMAAGIPAIATDFPLWRDIVLGAGSGLLVDPLDPESIARAMVAILESPDEARAMGERGRRAVLTRYNWATEAEKLLSLYRQVTA